MIEVKSEMATKINGVRVEVLKPGLIQVQSFTNPGKWYVVDRFERSCTCECFRLKGWCKHLRFILENEALVRMKESMWKADREFEEWRRKQAPALAALLALNTFKGSVEYWRA